MRVFPLMKTFFYRKTQLAMPSLFSFQTKKNLMFISHEIFSIDENPFLQKNLASNAFLWYIDSLNTMHVVVGWPIVASWQIRIFWWQIVIHSIFMYHPLLLPSMITKTQPTQLYFDTQKVISLCSFRDVNGPVLVQVHCRTGPETVKKKVEPDLKPSQDQFLGSGPKTVLEKVELDSEPKPYMGQVGSMQRMMRGKYNFKEIFSKIEAKCRVQVYRSEPRWNGTRTKPVQVTGPKIGLGHEPIYSFFFLLKGKLYQR